MLTDITIGQFFPGDSVLHRLDPRVKLVLLFVWLAAIFVFTTWPAYIFFAIFTLGLIGLSHIPFAASLRSLKPLWWIILFTFLIHLLAAKGESITATTVWGLSPTWEGLSQGGLISLRLALLIILSSLLTFTTSPLQLTDGLESLLRPLKKLGLPSHELAMMMTIALRFVPTIIEETDRIMKAQEARGANFSEGNLLVRAKNFVPILVPLFICAFRRADDLAMAMEARCYRGGVGRTRMKVLRIKRRDYRAIFFTLSVVGGLTALFIMDKL